MAAIFDKTMPGKLPCTMSAYKQMMEDKVSPAPTIDLLVDLFAEHLDVPVFLQSEDLTAVRVDPTTTKRYLDALMFAINAYQAAEGTPVTTVVSDAHGRGAVGSQMKAA